ncbi:hypothetical protein [Amycolatopsis aidingensis]|uniref:hypothetical protein n=1 Tax=Amycolatopsis aidingensis TaxID=2842453 RepID=UPI001C0B6140|nr:hypothetical protein [Amycolatopsis aidingensis]
MARSAPRGTDEQVTVADLVGRARTTPLRRAPENDDTKPFFTDALAVALGEQDEAGRGARHRAPEAAPARGRDRRGLLLLAAGGVLLFGLTGAVVFGLAGETVRGSAQPGGLPPPATGETSTGTTTTTTTTTTTAPPASTTNQRPPAETRPRRTVTKTTPPPEREPRSDRERVEDAVSSMLSEVSSRLDDWPSRDW